MSKIKIHINIALGYFSIIAFLGVLLRVFYITNISLNYKHLVHAHSHVALLGWIYTTLTTLIYFFYIKNQQAHKKYNTLFWFTQITIIGMLISFPIIGYALYSIIFSTLFLLASYWFFWFFIKHTSIAQKKTNSYKLIRAGLWFMVISTLGPWALGIIMNTLGNTSIWYKNAIYFYLHFQYNGWCIVTLLGVFFYFLEKQNISISKKQFDSFYWMLISSVILTVSISFLWTSPSIIFNFLGGFGSTLQLFAFGYLFKILRPFYTQIKENLSPLTFGILKTGSVFFFLKMTMQLLGSTSYFSRAIASHIDFAIGYLHWTFLGVISVFIFGFLHHFKLLFFSKRTVQLYLIGFVLTEILIFYKGIVSFFSQEIFEAYYLSLTLASAILFISIVLLMLAQFKKKI
ncbi:MAG: hypothetical protein KAH07_08385 [Flavobacteriaceae bacterium]|nr:hypothetical protein [Flavobacteriaceae bacterium]